MARISTILLLMVVCFLVGCQPSHGKQKRQGKEAQKVLRREQNEDRDLTKVELDRLFSIEPSPGHNCDPLLFTTGKSDILIGYDSRI